MSRRCVVDRDLSCPHMPQGVRIVTADAVLSGALRQELDVTPGSSVLLWAPAPSSEGEGGNDAGSGDGEEEEADGSGGKGGRAKTTASAKRKRGGGGSPAARRAKRTSKR